MLLRVFDVSAINADAKELINMKYGYTRVSTVNQDLQTQTQALKKKVVMYPI
jgi:hypothetical protein